MAFLRLGAIIRAGEFIWHSNALENQDQTRPSAASIMYRYKRRKLPIRTHALDSSYAQ